MTQRAGSSLAEVLVGIVILEVGLVGVAAMVVTASRTLARAEALSAAVSFAREVSDSLAGEDAAGSGSLRGEGLEVAWEGGTGGALHLRVRNASGEDVVTLVQRAPGLR